MSSYQFSLHLLQFLLYKGDYCVTCFKECGGYNKESLRSPGFPGGSELKNPSAMQEIQIWSLGWEDPLEEGMATHSSILAWKISWTEETGRLQSMGSQRVRHNWSNYACMHRSPFRPLFTSAAKNAFGQQPSDNSPFWDCLNWRYLIF